MDMQVVDRPPLATEATFWSALSHYKWRISVFVLLATVATFAGSHLLPPKYDATVVAIPIQQELRAQFIEQETGLFGAISPLQSRTTLVAGKHIERIRSMPFFLLVASNVEILPHLVEGEGDAEIPEGPAGAYTEPLWQAYARFNEMTRLSIDEDTGLVRITVRWGDPALAARWANAIVETLNDVRRGTDIDVSVARIEYLTGALRNSTTINVRTLLTERLAKEMQFMTLAQAQEEYSLEVISRAVPPFFPAFPKPPFMAALAFIVSLGAALLIVPVLYRRRI